MSALEIIFGILMLLGFGVGPLVLAGSFFFGMQENRKQIRFKKATEAKE